MDDTEKITRRLDRMLENGKIDDDTTMKYLNKLWSMDMTLEILTKTGIGIVINKLRKESNNSDITSFGKQIIKKWKKLVPGEKGETNAGSKRSANEGSKNSDDDQDSVKSMKKSKLAESTSPLAEVEPVSKPPQSSFFFAKNQDTSDPSRIKAREMLANALNSGEIPSGSFDGDFLATKIETAVFKAFDEVDSAYKQKIRTRVMNLRDSNNPNLRLNVLMGHVKPEKLAVMTSEEMASQEMKELREKYTKQTIEDHQMVVQGGTETDLLKCGKCRQNKCTYNQVQTRSADEPMTTFVYCNNCGHRWKFC